MTVFERYAPFVQDFIYAHRWEKLRSVQVAAGNAVFNTDKHVLLCASTASGKTEAAFFPILTLLSEEPPASVGALYIAPLKALINDQFERLTDLCAEGGIPVWAWHGDVAQSRKRKLIEHPSGILQITPESLEALLLRKHSVIPRLFGDLRFIVIDEIHSLMRGDRGGQTMCLIERLARLSGSDPRRIGLSATIGDPQKAADFLCGSSRRGAVVPQFEQPPVRWRLAMEHFFIAKKEEPHRTDYAPVMVDAQVSDQSAAMQGKLRATHFDRRVKNQDRGLIQARPVLSLNWNPLPTRRRLRRIPDWPMFLSIRRAESAWFFPIRAKSVRRSPVRCANTVAGQASRNVFSFITGISLRRCGLMPKR